MMIMGRVGGGGGDGVGGGGGGGVVVVVTCNTMVYALISTSIIVFNRA